jgi:hypothetical protein
MRDITARSVGMNWRSDAVNAAQYGRVRIVSTAKDGTLVVHGILEYVKLAKTTRCEWNGRRIAFAKLHGIFNAISDKVWDSIQVDYRGNA